MQGGCLKSQICNHFPGFSKIWETKLENHIMLEILANEFREICVTDAQILKILKID
jgi:hypothetical protein